MTVRCVGAALGSIKGFLFTVLLGLSSSIVAGMTSTAQGWLAQPAAPFLNPSSKKRKGYFFVFEVIKGELLEHWNFILLAVCSLRKDNNIINSLEPVEPVEPL